jgi:PIN domain nuclease of toxin-antitoxin system
MVTTLAKEIALRVCGLPFLDVVESAAKEKWIRDPFDRLIVAQAIANEAPW